MIDSFYAPRRFMLAPIDEIFHAAKLLEAAEQAEKAGETEEAARLILMADIPAIGVWTETLWGVKNPNIQRRREVLGIPPSPRKTCARNHACPPFQLAAA